MGSNAAHRRVRRRPSGRTLPLYDPEPCGQERCQGWMRTADADACDRGALPRPSHCCEDAAHDIVALAHSNDLVTVEAVDRDVHRS